MRARGRLALDVADAEALIWDGVIDPHAAAERSCSPTLHAEVLLVLAERDRDSALHRAGLTLAEAYAFSRAVAATVGAMRRQAAFSTATLPRPDEA